MTCLCTLAMYSTCFQHRPFNKIWMEFCQRLLSIFLGGHANHQLVLMRLLQIEPTYVVNALRDYYEENPLHVTRILDVAQDLKVRHLIVQRAFFHSRIIDSR